MDTLRLVALALSISLAAVPAMAHAQTHGVAAPIGGVETRSTQGGEAEARAAFTTAAAAFDEARFAEALTGFERSFTLSGRIELRYNMALCYDRLGRDAEALAAFEQYLEGRPDATNRADVEQRINTLRTRIAVREDLERQARETNRTPPPDPSGESSPVLGWVLAGAGGVLAIGGGIALVLGLGDVAAIEDAPVGSIWADDKARYDRGPTLEWVGRLGLGLGAAFVATGLVLVFSTGGSEAELALGPSGVTLRGRF